MSSVGSANHEVQRLAPAILTARAEKHAMRMLLTTLRPGLGPKISYRHREQLPGPTNSYRHREQLPAST